MTDLVAYALDSGVATLAMDDGKANVVSEAMIAALHAALDRAEADGAVVLITGRERFFSGGYDTALFASAPGDIIRTVRAGGELVHRILGFPRPVVAACTGHAIAQGAFLLLAADSRIGASGELKIGLNEVAIGLTIPRYGVEIARLRLATPWFHHATCTGALYPPDEALTAGFLDRVVEPDRVLELAREEALRLTMLNASAVADTKERVRGPALAAMREGIDAELAASV